MPAKEWAKVMCSYLLCLTGTTHVHGIHILFFFFLLSLSFYKLLVFHVSHATFTFYFK